MTKDVNGVEINVSAKVRFQGAEYQVIELCSDNPVLVLIAPIHALEYRQYVSTNEVEVVTAEPQPPAAGSPTAAPEGDQTGTGQEENDEEE